MANIIIFDDLILEIDEDFVAHLVVTDDTLNGRVTAGDLNDIVVTILDDEGKLQFEWQLKFYALRIHSI